MKTFKIFLFIIFVSVSASAQLTSYDYNRKLDKVLREDFYSIPLSPEITSRTKNNLQDFRIYNIAEEDTVEIPFMLEHLGDQEVEEPVELEIINDVTRLKCCSFVTLKMKNVKTINKISLEVLENNFDKILIIEGSNDNKEWFTIAQHLRIVAFENSNTSFRSTSVRFHNSEYSYYRIKFDDDSSPKITVTNAYAFENNTVKGKYDELIIKSKKQTENKKDKTSDIIIDLQNNYLLSYITLKSSEKSDFYRNVNIYRSAGIYHTPKGDEEAWDMVSSGVIISGQENLLPMYGKQSSKIRIEILNYDNQPITLNDIKCYSETTSLTSKLPASENLYLVYGKENASAPIYDLIHFRDKIPSALTAVKTGNEELKTSPVMNAAGEPLIKSKLWLWLIMGIVILLIGYFALSMLKKENSGKTP
jgi:hypothetical protein